MRPALSEFSSATRRPLGFYGALTRLHEQALEAARTGHISAPSPERDYKLPSFRPPRDFWGPLLNRAVQPLKPEVNPAPQPAPSPAPAGKGGKAVKAVVAFGDAAFETLFPPPPQPGIPAYIGNMSIGGRKPELE